MVLIKHNPLKSDIFLNPIFIPGFSGSMFFRVQVFQSPSPGSGSRVQGSGPDSGYGSRSMVRIQGPGSESSVQGPGPGSRF